MLNLCRVILLAKSKYCNMHKLFLFLLPLLLFCCTQTEEPEDKGINYDTHIKPIVTTNCISCHSGATPAANLDLTTYDNVKKSTQNGALIQRINDATNPMPQSGLMSTAERSLFDEWVKNNYKESN